MNNRQRAEWLNAPAASCLRKPAEFTNTNGFCLCCLVVVRQSSGHTPHSLKVDLFCNFCIIFMGPVSSMFLREGYNRFLNGIGEPATVAKIYCHTRGSSNVTPQMVISENDPTTQQGRKRKTEPFPPTPVHSGNSTNAVVLFHRQSSCNMSEDNNYVDRIWHSPLKTCVPPSSHFAEM